MLAVPTYCSEADGYSAHKKSAVSHATPRVLTPIQSLL